MKFIYSCGGYAREFQRCVKSAYLGEAVYLVEDNYGDIAISYEQALELAKENSAAFVVGFADPANRRIKTEQVLADGFPLFSVFALTSIIGDNVVIGNGAVFSDFSIVTADANIGQSFHCNIYSYIAHDCLVGDYVTLAPRVSVNGRVTIGDNVYIGTGATVLPGISIGSGAIVGAHALVTKDVAPGTTVVGTPATLISKK